jgi:hypothetical protein
MDEMRRTIPYSSCVDCAKRRLLQLHSAALSFYYTLHAIKRMPYWLLYPRSRQHTINEDLACSTGFN